MSLYLLNTAILGVSTLLLVMTKIKLRRHSSYFIAVLAAQSVCWIIIITSNRVKPSGFSTFTIYFKTFVAY